MPPDAPHAPIQQQLAWTDNDYKLWVHLENKEYPRDGSQGWHCAEVQHGVGSRANCSYIYRCAQFSQSLSGRPVPFT